MPYNTEKLPTTADCDAAIAMATKRKATLTFSQTVQGKDLTNQEEIAINATADLIVINSKIVGAEAAFVTLPEGERKTKLSDELRRLNDKKGNLEARLRDNGSAALLDTELDTGLLRAQVAEIETYIADIQVRKATL